MAVYGHASVLDKAIGAFKVAGLQNVPTMLSQIPAQLCMLPCPFPEKLLCASALCARPSSYSGLPVPIHESMPFFCRHLLFFIKTALFYQFYSIPHFAFTYYVQTVKYLQNKAVLSFKLHNYLRVAIAWSAPEW